jgi:hypothetical protein
MDEELSSAADLRAGDARTLIQQLAERIDRISEA